MSEKVILILNDGMRPDGMLQCAHPFVNEFMSQSSCALDAQTVFPSVTLPCHMSLFHSVPPDRHGVLTNLFTPQVRPVDGLFERLSLFGKNSAMFYTWEELRDLERPGHLVQSLYMADASLGDCSGYVTAAAIDCYKNLQPDFIFLYLGWTDVVGHDKGWMSPEYLRAIHTAWECIRSVCREADDETTLIVTADHGGHDRIHGTTMPEDMTIPVLCKGGRFAAGKTLKDVSILDIAPTIASILGITGAREWEGKSLID